MNMHRLHTLDIPPTRPAPLTKPRIQRVGLFREDPAASRGFQLVGGALFVLLLAVWAFAQFFLDSNAPEARPVRTQTVEVFALPPASVEEARIEGFRAGLATAYAEGCPATALTHPLGSE